LNKSILRGWGTLSGAWGQVKAFALEHPLDPFPLRHTLKGYNSVKAKADAKAGLTVALLDLPQGMAYAVIAGLPLWYGATCSAVAALVGPLLASSRHTMLGPTNATAFMTFSFFAAHPNVNQMALMPMLVFLVGALLIMGGYFRIADLAQYISRTVIVAYVTGASILIMANQLPSLLGVVVPRDGSSRTLFGTLGALLDRVGQVQWTSLLLTCSTLGLFLLLKRWRPHWPVFVMVLVLMSAAGWLMEVNGIAIATYANAKFYWYDLLPPIPDFLSGGVASQFSQLFGLAVAIAFVATLEQSAMSKTIASRGNYRVDANQDMLSLGTANLACAYLSGMPASGSLTRSALNFDSGARTPVSSMVNGAICLVGALTIGPLVGHIPRAVLATLVICIALSLVNRRQIRISLRATKSDALVFVVTLGATLLVPLHVAIFTGVGVSIMLYLRKASQPSLVEYEFNQEGNLAEALGKERQNPSISIVHVEGDLFFGAAELFRTQIQRTCSDPNLKIIILRLKNARHLDATSVMALEELIRVMQKSDRHIIISGAMRDVVRVLRNSGLIDVLGRENLFVGNATNPNISTRDALKRAQEILGFKEADVHIYYDPRHSKKTEAAS
jgi:SulP family sulfate permease